MGTEAVWGYNTEQMVVHKQLLAYYLHCVVGAQYKQGGVYMDIHNKCLLLSKRDLAWINLTPQ